MGKWREAFDRGRPNRWEIEDGLEYTFGPPATEEQLADVERKLGVQLPNEVRELLFEFNGVWYTSRIGRSQNSYPSIIYLNIEYMTVSVPRYIRAGRDSTITRRGSDLRKVSFVAQVNGLADLYGVCLETIGEFPVGMVVKLDHETWELEAVRPTLLEFVEHELKPD